MVRLATRTLITNFAGDYRAKTKVLCNIYPELIVDEEELFHLILTGIEEATKDQDCKQTAALVFFEMYTLVEDFSEEIIEWWNSSKVKHLHGHPYWTKIIS